MDDCYAAPGFRARQPSPGRPRITCDRTCMMSRAFAVDKLLTSAEGVPVTKSMMVLPLIKGAKELVLYPGRRPVHVDSRSDTGSRGIRITHSACREESRWGNLGIADRMHQSRAASFAIHTCCKACWKIRVPTSSKEVRRSRHSSGHSRRQSWSTSVAHVPLAQLLRVCR